MTSSAKVAVLSFLLFVCAVAVILTRDEPSSGAAFPLAGVLPAVNSQLRAFRTENYAHAYLLATNEVRAKISLRDFEEMMRAHSAEFRDVERVEFGDAVVEGERATVVALLYSVTGTYRCYRFHLVAQDDGWKIEELEPVPPPPSKKFPTGLRI